MLLQNDPCTCPSILCTLHGDSRDTSVDVVRLHKPANIFLLGVEAAAWQACHENMVRVEAGMASRALPDGLVITVFYSHEEGYEYSYGETPGGLRGVYPTRALCLFDIEARLAQVVA